MKNAKQQGVYKKSVRWALIFLLSVLCILWLFPLYYIIITSFRTDDAVMFNGYALWPDPFTVDTYIQVFSDTSAAPVLTWFFNSLFVSVVSMLLIVIVDAMAAYGYARLHFKGRDVLFMGLMFTMMIPGVINLVPQYSIISALGLRNNYAALILPGIAGVGNIFLIRQFFYSVPKDFDEAATIDGANEIRIFFYILLPQIVPVLVVVGLFSFLGSWNDLLWPLIVMTDNDMRTLTAGLSVLNGQYDREYASKMAATVISAIPVLIIYLCAQKFLLQGVSISSGIKV